jgi:hypothetical protein
MADFWLELLLSVAVAGLFLSFLAWLNRKGYAQNLNCLEKIAKSEGLQVYHSPIGGSLWRRAAYEPEYLGATGQYAYLRGGWQGFDLQLRSIRRRARPFATRLSLRWAEKQPENTENPTGTLLLCPKGSAARYKTDILQVVDLVGALSQDFELLTDQPQWALSLLNSRTAEYLYQQKAYLRGPLCLSPQQLYTEEADLILTPPQVETIQARLKILAQLAQYFGLRA